LQNIRVKSKELETLNTGEYEKSGDWLIVEVEQK
jgi:hypothetical protein